METLKKKLTEWNADGGEKGEKNVNYEVGGGGGKITDIFYLHVIVLLKRLKHMI